MGDIVVFTGKKMGKKILAVPGIEPEPLAVLA